MASQVAPVPPGYHTVTPYIIVDGAAKAIEFYKRAFEATELLRLPAPNGKLGHAEIRIGNSNIMLADEHPEYDARGPISIGGTPITLMLYVPNVDAFFARALAAGATELMPVKDQFYGDRSGMLADPFGHKWTIATHQEDVPPEEIGRRYAALVAQK